MARALNKQAYEFAEVHRSLADDIFKFATACGFVPTWQQKQLMLAVQKAVDGHGNPRIAVKSGQGPGKSTVSGVIGLWLMFREPYTKLIVTAPTMRQCRDVWLAEAKQTLRRASPVIRKLFNVTGSGIGMFGKKPSEWGCLLITATRAENAQGQHRKDMHIIAEEASGIPREQIEQYKGTLSNPNAIFIQIGNPNTRDCAFFDCFNSQRHKWECFTWNAEETPASEWFDPKRNQDIADEYGKNSDVYRVRVLGEFPYADPNCLMSSEDIEKCMDRSKMVRLVRMSGGKVQKQFGMDFARYGGDESAIMRRSGLAIVEQWWQDRVDPNTVVDKAFAMQSRAGWDNGDCMFVIDASGMGQGLAGNFHRASKRVHEFHNHGKATKSDYANKITQAWFRLAKLVQEHGCYLPYDNQLIQQLSTRQYFTDNKGRLILEKKDDYIKRGFTSPDRADTAVLAFWDGGMATGDVSTKARQAVRAGVVTR